MLSGVVQKLLELETFVSSSCVMLMSPWDISLTKSFLDIKQSRDMISLDTIQRMFCVINLRSSRRPAFGPDNPPLPLSWFWQTSSNYADVDLKAKIFSFTSRSRSQLLFFWESCQCYNSEGIGLPWIRDKVQSGTGTRDTAFLPYCLFTPWTKLALLAWIYFQFMLIATTCSHTHNKTWHTVLGLSKNVPPIGRP